MVAAEGTWRWAHIISGHELDQFDPVFERIRSICPNYMPERQLLLLSAMDAVFGPDGACNIPSWESQANVRIRRMTTIGEGHQLGTFFLLTS